MSKEIGRRHADANHDVVAIKGTAAYRREPCEQCPWRRDVPTGVFPAEAFRLAANTAYDASFHQFACHMSGPDKMATCAGFLLANSVNNVGTRIALSNGRINLREVSSPVPLYGSYREMAEANGVAPDDPVWRRAGRIDEPAENDLPGPTSAGLGG